MAEWPAVKPVTGSMFPQAWRMYPNQAQHLDLAQGHLTLKRLHPKRCYNDCSQHQHPQNAEKDAGMAHTRARVDGATLVAPGDDAGPIDVGTPAWFAWLDLDTAFTFSSPSGSFTAHKERRTRGAGTGRPIVRSMAPCSARISARGRI
jgi:hypothetical protein